LPGKGVCGKYYIIKEQGINQQIKKNRDSKTKYLMVAKQTNLMHNKI
jgi:hypothetical protein